MNDNIYTPTWKIIEDLNDVQEALGEIDYDNLDTVTEGYVGNTKDVQKLVKACDAACTFMANKNNIIDLSLTHLDSSKEIRNIELVLKGMFGFKEMHLQVFNCGGHVSFYNGIPIFVFDDGIQAYTITKSPFMRNATTSMPRLPTYHGERYYDESHQYFCYVVTYNEMFTLLNGEEMAAVLLHEIGHNFDVTMTNYFWDLIGWALTLTSPRPLLSMLIRAIQPEWQFAWGSITKILDYIPIVPLFFNLGITGVKAFTYLLGPLGATTHIIYLLTSLLSGGAIGSFVLPKEAFADSFVAAHGLGAAYISALNKLDKVEYVTKYGPLVEFWTGTGPAIASFTALFIDPHPETQTRAKLILMGMKEASEDPTMPKSLRKVAKEDYQKCKRAYDQFLEADPDERNACITRFTRNLKESLFGGKVDLRALLWARFGTSALHNH